jgi:ribosomal protein L44E
MAKKGGKSSGVVSKGERRSSMKTSGYGVTPAEKMNRKMEALRKGKDVVFTIANPNKTQTNKPFIRVKQSGKSFLKGHYVLSGSETG